MVKYGMTPVQALRAATVNAAELLGMKNVVGELTPGALSDIVAVEGNPLQDVKALQQVKFVMKAGVIYKQ
jgi:imidazolonepropionase-like amidohydrolase